MIFLFEQKVVVKIELALTLVTNTSLNKIVFMDWFERVFVSNLTHYVDSLNSNDSLSFKLYKVHLKSRSKLIIFRYLMYFLLIMNQLQFSAQITDKDLILFQTAFLTFLSFQLLLL